MFCHVTTEYMVAIKSMLISSPLQCQDTGYILCVVIVYLLAFVKLYVKDNSFPNLELCKVECNRNTFDPVKAVVI